MNLFHKILILLFGVAISVQAVPPVLNYAGQVAVNGEAFDGNGLFKFALVNTDGTTTYWSNDGTSVDGSQPQASVAVSVNGGLYAVLLGNTALQGMGAIDPAVFAQHTDAKLRVWFSDGVNGFQQLSPDRPFASVPYAFNSESAKSAETANTAMAVQPGAVTSSMLASNAVTSDKLSPQIKADINATIGMNRLSTEVTEKLNQEKTTTNYNAPSVGSLLAVPSGQPAPSGYSLYQRGEPKELVWEEKAPVSVPRYAFDGVEVLDNKIYFVGGYNGSFKNIAERYDPTTDTWETLTSMSTARRGIASAVLNGKLYAIGGQGVASVEVYDPSTESWSSGVALPSQVSHGTAITTDGKIYLIGGKNASNQKIDQVLCFDPSTNQWSTKANMPTARESMKLVWFGDRIWAIGGYSTGYTKIVESYDPTTNSWQNEASLTELRFWPVAWVASGRIYSGGGYDGSSYLNSIEVYDPTTKKWLSLGNFPENKYVADAVVLNDKIYVIAGSTSSGVHSNKVFAADLNASVEGVYDLYRKDGDAPVGTPIVQSEYADGSVTTSKLDATILKYLKPEITSQPQSQIVYTDSNVSFSVSAEGKYLAYQWKKDGVDLAGETKPTLTIVEANQTLHEGNYSILVSNDFGKVQSDLFEFLIASEINEISGLTGWWKFDETSGTVAYDSSGNERDGNLTNGPSWNTGKIGGSLSFDGNDDVLDLPITSFPLGNSASINFWAYGGSNLPKSNSIIKSVNLETTQPLLNIHLSWLSTCKVYWDIGNVLYRNRLETLSSLADIKGRWVMWTFQKDSSNNTMKIFTDANLFALAGGKSIQTSSLEDVDYLKVGIGYHGLIDDLRIYDRALSAEEVQALYNLGQ